MSLTFRKTLWLALCSIFLLLGCRQTPPPDEPPAAVQETTAFQSYTLVLQGYEDGAARRRFQAELEKLGLDVELLQSGANQAEYQVIPGKGVSEAWIQSLSATFAEQYEVTQAGARLLFVRR